MEQDRARWSEIEWDGRDRVRWSEMELSRRDHRGQIQGRISVKSRCTWSEMPVEAASEMIAISFLPSMKAFRSETFKFSISDDSGFARASSTKRRPSAERTIRDLRPVISATAFLPPSSSISTSSAAGGSSSAFTCGKGGRAPW